MSVSVEPTEMVEYSTASILAATYAEQLVRVREAVATLADVVNSLQHTFTPQDSYSFDIRLNTGHYGSDGYKVTDDRLADWLESSLHRSAWRVLVIKLGIRKMMSSKRSKQLDDLLENGPVVNEQGERETLRQSLRKPLSA